MPRLHVVALVVLGWAASQYGAQAQDAAVPAMPALMASPLERSRIAIAECRELRLKKQLPSYKASAECSNPKIFAAWQEANYPHMDLITAWLSAREAASEKVDQHIITPKEFERQMDELTVRLTAEEQRRRAGLVNSSDGDLVLQLPPSTQVVGVATPPGQEKIAAKKTAAARARAASNDQYVDPSSVGSLSAAESGRPIARPGVGGPLVPVAGAGRHPGCKRHPCRAAKAAEACTRIYRRSAATPRRIWPFVPCRANIPMSWAAETPSSAAPTTAVRAPITA